MHEPLTAFWIVPPDSSGPRGYGVTAFTLSDALSIIRRFGCQLPDDLSTLRIIEGIRVADLDDFHVVPNMGPIVVRGMWYPLFRQGM